MSFETRHCEDETQDYCKGLIENISSTLISFFVLLFFHFLISLQWLILQKMKKVPWKIAKSLVEIRLNIFCTLVFLLLLFFHSFSSFLKLSRGIFPINPSLSEDWDRCCWAHEKQFLIIFSSCSFFSPWQSVLFSFKSLRWTEGNKTTATWNCQLSSLIKFFGYWTINNLLCRTKPTFSTRDLTIN